MKISALGIDLAKAVFQVHGVDEQERVVARKRLSRNKLLKFGSSGISVGKKRPNLSAGLRMDSPWISTRHPWRDDRVENPWNARSSHTTGFPH